MIGHNLWGYDSYGTNNKMCKKDCFKLKSSYTANEAINKVKNQSSQWE